MIDIGGIIQGANQGIGMTLGVVSMIVGFVQSSKAKRAAKKEAERQAEAEAARLKELENLLDEWVTSFDTFAANEEERIFMQRLKNGELHEAEMENIAKLQDKMLASIDTFSLERIAALDVFLDAMNQVTADVNAGYADALNDFNTIFTDSIINYAANVSGKLNATREELQAIREQMSADMGASIEMFMLNTGVVHGEAAENIRQSLLDYNLVQGGRNNLINELMANASSSFANVVEQQTIIRESIVGDALEKLGIELNNVNDGIAAILGVTPEEALGRARAASQDFASHFLQATGDQAGLLAQQQARMAGLPRGQAALMQVTAISEAMRGNWAEATNIGLDQYRVSEQRQTEALADQYARERDYQQELMNQARLDEQAAREAALEQARLDQEQAAALERESERARADTEMNIAAEQDIRDTQREDLQKILDAQMEKAREESQAARDDEKWHAESYLKAYENEMTASQKQAQSNLEAEQTRIEGNRLTDTHTATTALSDTADRLTTELNTKREDAKDIADRTSAENQRNYLQELSAQERERGIDKERMGIAQDRVNIATGREADAAQRAADASAANVQHLNNLSNNLIGAGAGAASSV